LTTILFELTGTEASRSSKAAAKIYTIEKPVGPNPIKPQVRTPGVVKEKLPQNGWSAIEKKNKKNSRN